MALSTKQKYATKMMADFYASHIRNMKKFAKEIYPDYSDDIIEYKAVQFATLIDGMMIILSPRLRGRELNSNYTLIF